MWLILNRASRTVAGDWAVTLSAAFEARGYKVAGVSAFPDDPLPTPGRLDEGGVTLVAVAAGDGTINAVARHLDAWSGVLLVLPGGTMNLLAKSLHGDAQPEAIIAALAHPPRTRALATVDCGDERAVVGVIVGPAASWVHAREAVRHGRWGRLRRAVRLAVARSLSKSIKLKQGNRRSRGLRAVFIHPDDDALSVIKVGVAGWADGVRLGWSYVRGSWADARGVDTERTASVTLAMAEPSFALFDGEPVRLPPGATLSLGYTHLRFVTTLETTA